MPLRSTLLLLSLLLLLSGRALYGQAAPPVLDLEQADPATGLPRGWQTQPATRLHIGLDTLNPHGGQRALRIQRMVASVEAPFSATSRALPAPGTGRQVTLTGYLKTHAVQGGHGGLWLRVDGPSGLLASTTLSPGPTGTTPWTLYSLTLPLPAGATTLLVGGRLSGTGTLWLDDLEVLVDGQPLSAGPTPALSPSPALVKPVPYAATALLDSRDRPLLRLRSRQREHLTVLGRVWGFVKYYHPAVATGTRDWDQALLTLLPRVLASPTRAARNQLLSQWLDSLGPVPPCPTCAPPDSAARVLPALAWLGETRQLGPALSAQLRHLQANRAQGPHAYVAAARVGQAHYWENPDGEVAYPSVGYRLLALFRYWNIVEYYFPYKQDIGEPWPAVLREFVPRVIGAADAQAYHLTMLALIARVHDSHATLPPEQDPVLAAYWGAYQAPVRLVFVDEQPVVAQVYAAAGTGYPLERGDVITHVGREPVRRWIRRQQALVPASNRPTQRRNMAGLLLRGATAQLPVRVRRAGKTITVVAPRRRLGRGWLRGEPLAVDSGYRFVQPTIGYLNVGRVRTAQLPTIMRTFQSTKGLIVDLRQYPREVIVYPLTRYLVREATAFAQLTGPDLRYPGQFLPRPPLLVGPGSQPAYAGRVVILVNEHTQSRGEFTAMALRTVPGAVVLGSTTAGADGDVSNDIFLPGGLVTKITGLGVYYPDGRATQRVGIVPDVVVHPTVAGIRAGRDELLEHALRLLSDSPAGAGLR